MLKIEGKVDTSGARDGGLDEATTSDDTREVERGCQVAFWVVD